MEEDIELLKEKINNGYIYVNCGNFVNKAIENILNELERLQKENNDLRAIKETIRYLEEDGEKDDLYYVIGRGSYLAGVLENAQDFKKTVHTCLHCGNDTPLYCEKCQQELISKNTELQMRYEKINKFLHSNSFVFQNENGDIQGMLLTPENFIPKQVIRDKIKKLKNEFDFYAGREHAEWQDGEFDGDVCDDLALQIKVLKELLGE